MKSRRYFYCILGVVMAGAILFLLLTFLPPRAVEAQASLPIQPAAVTQGPEHPLVVFPNPPQAHEPTEIRVFWYNSEPTEVTRYAQFFWSPFGIGMERNPISGRIPFVIPSMQEGTAFVTWVPADIGPYCFYVDIFDAPEAPQPVAVFQHNVTFRGYPDPQIPVYTEVVEFPLRNPTLEPATVILTLTIPAGTLGWQGVIEPRQVHLSPGEMIPASAVFTYTGPAPLPPEGTVSFNVDASANGMGIGGVDIVFLPPVQLHMRPEPVYAESEISVNPYPVPPGEPAEICVEVRNVTQQPREALVFFAVAPFGIAMPFEPAAPPVQIFIPELGMRRPCIHWVAPQGGQFAFEVRVETPGFPMVGSLRVVDVNEVLLPGATSELLFPVRNPFPQPVTITLGMIPFQEWQFSLDQDVLPNMQPGEVRMVLLTVTVPPDAIMPPDGTPVVDIEAFVGRDSIGGFRKIYRPPVPIHQPGDPIYAEREISISPYPPREREPTVICVEIRNPTAEPMTITVDFNVGEFGIGLPYHQIARPILVNMPAHSIQKVCVTWVPPFGGRFAAEVGLTMEGHERIYSQRVIDVGEILYAQPALALRVHRSATRSTSPSP